MQVSDWSLDSNLLLLIKMIILLRYIFPCKGNKTEASSGFNSHLSIFVLLLIQNFYNHKKYDNEQKDVW